MSNIIQELNNAKADIVHAIRDCNCSVNNENDKNKICSISGLQCIKSIANGNCNALTNLFYSKE